MTGLLEIYNLNLLSSILIYAAELALRVIPMMVTAIFVAESARLWLGEDRLKVILSGRLSWTGRFRAAVLGAVLPFCECGAFPVMFGLIRAGVPSSAVLTFFIISPVVSMPAFMILIAVFGLPLAISYLLITFSAGLIGGSLLEPIGQRWGMLKEGIAFKEESKTVNLQTACGASCTEVIGKGQCCNEKTSSINGDNSHGTFTAVIAQAFIHTVKLLKKILPYMTAVIIVSALLRNLIPPNLIESSLAARAPYDILIGALAGIPIYTGDCAMIALAAPLIGATGAVGAGIAFIISGSGTSISGIIFMSSVFKRRFIVLYVFTILCIALVAGYLIAALLTLGII